MSGVKTSLAAIVVFGALVTSSQAQGVVPGGWAPEFGVQAFGNSGMSGGMSFGYGTPGFGAGFSPYGSYGNGFGFGSGFSPYGYGLGFGPNMGRPVYPGGLNPAAGTMNQTDSLIGAIRGSVRSSRRR